MRSRWIRYCRPTPGHDRPEVPRRDRRHAAQLPGAPNGSTVVLYTEKILAYFIVGTTNGAVSKIEFKAGAVTLGTDTTINYTPSVHPSEPLPTTGSFKIYLGTAVGSPIQEVTCSGNACIADGCAVRQ